MGSLEPVIWRMDVRNKVQSQRLAVCSGQIALNTTSFMMWLEAYDSPVSKTQEGSAGARGHGDLMWSVLVRRKEEIAILPKGTHSLVLAPKASAE